MLNTGLVTLLRRALGLKSLAELQGPAYYYDEARKDGLGSLWRERWAGTEPYVEFRATDEVLDIGCAEGLVALELAKSVKRVHGIEVHAHRVERALDFARELGRTNFTAEAVGIEAAEFAPLSYDVVLMQGVYGYDLGGGREVGPRELEKTLRAARRQVVLRLNVQDDARAARWLPDIFETCEREGFDVAAFPKFDRYENLIVALRRGSGARLRQVPQLMLVPTKLAPDQPVAKGAPLAPWRFGRPA
jgi:SAM-dependent methyltransferase